VNLGGVTIGDPTRVTVATLQVGTDFRALLSRRIAHATLYLAGARIELPLPPFTFGNMSPPSSESRAVPVEIVSIDDVVLRDVTIVSGGRTLQGDIDMVPHDRGITIRKVSLRADDATIDITGEVSDTAGPIGELALKADILNVDRLLAFVSDFARDAVTSTAQPLAPAPVAARRPAPDSSMNLAVSLETARATIGTMTFDHFAGRARVTPQDVTLDPIRFGVFGGGYDGTLVLTLGAIPDFRLKASVSDVDMETATTFAGSPGAITGRLSGRMDLAGHGMDAATASRSVRGTVRADIRNGVVRRLGLLRAVVLATSMRADSMAAIPGEATDEPFSQLGATLAVSNGSASTLDLRFESKDLSVAGAGRFALNGSSVNLKGQVQLSEALTQQAGRDLVRYTQEQGRVTLPIEVTGSADKLFPRIDVASAAGRAIRNRANEELQKALKEGFKELLK
jgi:uncharacterized protein involved in outer membrane biogenesis